MAMREVEPYIFDPESESEMEEPRRADGSTFWVQNGETLCPPYKSISHHPGSIEVTFGLEQTEDYVSDPEEPAPSDEDEVSEEERPKKGNASSDEDWLPHTLTEEGTEEPKRNTSSSSEEEDSGEEEERDGEQKPAQGHKKKQLCTDCGAFYQSLNHVCEHKTKPYVCNVCGKRCVTELSLKLHSNIHSETYQHYCKFCYATFKTKLDKHTHEETHQNEAKPYKCPDCSMIFARHRERRTHLKKHKGPNEFKCDVCGLSIGKKHKLRHMMTHTGAKPFKCVICERTFNQSGNLKSHMRVHTGEQPYKCKHCDKSFNHNVSLKSHVQRYHPLNSEDVTSDGATDTSENVQKQETKKIQQKAKRNPYATGRPLGRPKRPSAIISDSSWFDSSEENVNFNINSFDGSKDFTDGCSFDLSEEKDEQMIRINQKSQSDSDSDYDPDKEQRGRPRKK